MIYKAVVVVLGRWLAGSLIYKAVVVVLGGWVAH